VFTSNVQVRQPVMIAPGNQLRPIIARSDLYNPRETQVRCHCYIERDWGATIQFCTASLRFVRIVSSVFYCIATSHSSEKWIAK